MHRFAPLVLLLAALPGLAQLTQDQLKRLYPQATLVGSTIRLGDGVEMKAVYSTKKQLCLLTVTGPTEEPELFKIFDTVAPPKSRGAKGTVLGGDLIVCSGFCLRTVDYEKVRLRSGLIGSQTSNPAGTIEFLRPDCAAASEIAKTIVFHIDHARR